MIRSKHDNKSMQINSHSSNKAWMTSKPTPWFSTTELLEYLGISKSELDQQLKLFSEGIHYRREKPDQPESQLLWRIDLIDEILCLPVAPLEKEAMLKAINNEITCN